MKNFSGPLSYSQSRSSLAREKSRHGVHDPVLLEEVIEYLNIKPNGIYVDATFGRGGHTRAILEHLDQGRLIALDKDQEAIEQAKLIKDSRFIAKHGSFGNLNEWIKNLGLEHKINGILLDLGVSSPQLDNPSRGFSFLHDGPLDMRMDLTQKTTAADWLNNAKTEEIANVLKIYGEERFHKKIANAIVKERAIKPISTTLELADIVTKAHPKWELHKHPATRTFQALRIFINNELRELQNFLNQCLDLLDIGGRLVVISFHSLEFRIVKEFVYKYSKGSFYPKNLPLKQEELGKKLKLICRAIRPGSEEIARNPRARSAILTVAEKIS